MSKLEKFVESLTQEEIAELETILETRREGLQATQPIPSTGVSASQGMPGTRMYYASVVANDHPDIQNYIDKEFERIDSRYKNNENFRLELRIGVAYSVAMMFFDIDYDDRYTRKQLDEFFSQLGMTFDEAMKMARSGS